MDDMRDDCVSDVGLVGIEDGCVGNNGCCTAHSAGCAQGCPQHRGVAGVTGAQEVSGKKFLERAEISAWSAGGYGW